MFLKRRGGKVVEPFFELAPALRQQDRGGIQLVGGLRQGCQIGVKLKYPSITLMHE